MSIYSKIKNETGVREEVELETLHDKKNRCLQLDICFAIEVASLLERLFLEMTKADFFTVLFH